MRAAAILTLGLVSAAAASAAAPDGTTQHYFTITLKEGRVTGGSTAGKGEQLEIQSFHWGPRQSTSADGSRTRTGILMTMDDKDGREKLQPGGGGAGDANETLTVGGNHSESGQATGKRQHKPMTITKEWGARSAPLPQGSVRVKVKFPWLGCKVGASYPRLELAGGGKRYVLEDVEVASCGGWTGPGDEGPEESITFVYGKLG